VAIVVGAAVGVLGRSERHEMPVVTREVEQGVALRWGRIVGAIPGAGE
jgi:hypothetical protein